MSERTPVAVVTGGNRGLGRETCRQLRERGYRVWVAARDVDAAREAAAAIGGEPLELDVTSADSVAAAAAALAARGEPIDALVNNAGVSLDGFDAEVARRTLAVNLDGAVAVCDALAPQLAPGGIIANVSSGMGELACLSVERRAELADPSLDRATLAALMRGFVDDVAAGRWRERGWPGSAYRVSKAALNAFTRILARELGDAARVNAVCPGWVRTDMGGPSASRDVSEGAASIVWAATEVETTGGFFRDGAAIDW